MREIIVMSLLAAGSVLTGGAAVHAQTTPTTVSASSYDDDWYRDYYCWIAKQYSHRWNLDSSYYCDASGATTSTTMPPTTTTAPTTTTTAAPLTTTVAPLTTTLAPSGDVVVSLLTSTSAPVRANANSWVTLNWTVIGGNADTFHVKATAGKGVSVTYPTNTAGYTSLSGGEQLANLEVDLTAVKLIVPAGVTGSVTVSVYLTYQAGESDKGETYTVTVPVAAS